MNTTYRNFIAAGCLSVIAFSGCTSLPGMRSEIVGGAKTEFVVRGQNSPVVVLEAGLGDGMDGWAPVFDRISSFATVFAYNRAGYGHSASRDEPRSGARIVDELRATLAQAGLRPPYVLVGHSLGGTYMELFARRFPAEVAGLVLVEARAASMTRRCREARLLMCDPPKFLVAALPGAAAAEYSASDETFRQVEAADPLPRLPLIVLTSTRPRLLEGPAWSQLWNATQQELAAQSPLGKQLTTWISGHYIHKAEPRLVVEAVREVVSASSAHRP